MEIEFLLTGLILGLSAGCSPGPLLTLVVSETLLHGIKGGVKVALAPLITDLPIILATLFIISRLSGFQSVLGILSLAGGLFILSTGYASLRIQAADLTGSSELQSRSLKKAVVANFLNPHPYLFWISVGGPVMTRAFTAGTTSLALFIGGFYLALVGSKIVLALAVGRSRSFLSGKAYLTMIRLLGALLCGFALLLFREGFKLLGFM